MNNLEEMGKFLETYNLPRLNKEEIDYLNRSITSSEIEFAGKKKKSRPDSFTGEFYQINRVKIYLSPTIPKI